MSSRLGDMVSDAREVVRDPAVCNGAPSLEGTRIRVSDIAVAYDHRELAPEEIVGEFPVLNVQDVHSALAYYLSRPEEIRAEIRAREETFEAAR